MADQIPNWYAPTFKTNVEMLLQNEGNKLEDTVRQETFQGEGARLVNQWGQADAAQINRERNGDTPTMDVPMTARWIFSKSITWATQIDNRDDLYSVVDPQSSIVSSAALEHQRQVDGIILTAMFGSGLAGKVTQTAVPFDPTMYVDVDTGGVGSGLNVAKLRRAKKLLMKNFNPVTSKKIYCALDSEQWEDLLEDIQITNKDYGGVGPLYDGDVRYFMGIEFRIIEFDATPGGAITKISPVTGAAMPGAQRVIPVYMQDAITLGTWRGMETKIDLRPDKNYSTQVWSEQVRGGTRTQEKTIVAVAVNEA